MVHRDIYRNGTKLVSVTELTSIIAKPFLDIWRKNLCCPNKGLCGFDVGKQKASEAAGLGNEVHSVVEAYLKKDIQPVVSDVALDWANKVIALYAKDEVKPFLIEPEETLIDEESNLAGSPDAVVMWKEEALIADIKVKNQLDDLTAMQGVGYRYLIKRRFGVEIDVMRVQWCNKKLKNRVVKLVDIELKPWIKDWESLVRLWNRLNPKREVKILG